MAMTGLAAAMGHRAILLLPINETSPGESSPYSALSLFAIDPVYIGLDGLGGVEQPQVEDARHALSSVPLSDRLTIRAARIALLEAAFAHFVAHGDGREAVADFTARHRDWLEITRSSARSKIISISSLGSSGPTNCAGANLVRSRARKEIRNSRKRSPSTFTGSFSLIASGRSFAPARAA